jgi:hypothetical protein
VWRATAGADIWTTKGNEKGEGHERKDFSFRALRGFHGFRGPNARIFSVQG